MKKTLLQRQIEQELTQIQVMVAETERMLEKVQRTGDKDYLGTIALNLHSFYTAVERILIAIAKEIDGVIPKEENWHQALLKQMAVEIPGARVDLPQRRPAVKPKYSATHETSSKYGWASCGKVVAGVRQSVLAIQTQQGLDEFLRFRHVVRSNYAHQLDPEQLQALARKLDMVKRHLMQDCQQFCAGLQLSEQQQ